MENPETKILLDFNGRHSEAEKEFLLGVQERPGVFRIKSSPRYAYGLNYNDLVSTDVGTTRHGNYILITGLVEVGGHRTARGLFHSFVNADERFNVLKNFSSMVPRVTATGADTFAVDFPPGDKSSKAWDYLSELKAAGYIKYEDCEEVVRGSFGNMIVVKDIYLSRYVSCLLDRVNVYLDEIYDGHYREEG